MTYDEVMRLEIEFVNHRSFAKLDVQKTLREKMPASPGKMASVPKSLPAYLQHMYRVRLLTREQERYLFRRMNFMLRTAFYLRAALKPKDNTRRHYFMICWKEAMRIRNLIIESNLRLVVSVAKKNCRIPDIFELISTGNLGLIRAVEMFDYSRGNKFSTYARYAIQNRMWGRYKVDLRYEQRFPRADVSLGQILDREPAIDSGLIQEDAEVAVKKLLRRVSPREEKYIKDHYGIGRPKRILEAIGDEDGYTKERVRQVIKRGLYKMGKR